VLRDARRRDIAAIAFTALGLACWVFDGPHGLAALLLAAAALLQAQRLVSWAPWRTWRRPILWVLHLSYAWIPLGLALLAAERMGWLPASMGVHALAVGAIAGMVIGMMTRTARGHTGRALKVSPVEVGAYALLAVAALVRVFVPFAWPALYSTALLAAGGLWIAAFAIYLVRYTPWLMAARPDGQDG